jgi:hypothetical protein
MAPRPDTVNVRMNIPDTASIVAERELARCLRSKVGLLTEAEVTLMLELGPQTLGQWRMKGRGPKYCHLGKRVFYTDKHIFDWIEASTRQCTTEVSVDLT